MAVRARRSRPRFPPARTVAVLALALGRIGDRSGSPYLPSAHATDLSSHPRSLHAAAHEDTSRTSQIRRLKDSRQRRVDSHRGLSSTVLDESFAVSCRMTVVDYLYADVDNEISHRAQRVGCIPLDAATSAELDLVLTVDVPEQVYRMYRSGIETGTALLRFGNATLSEDEGSLVLWDSSVTALDAAERKLLLVAPPPTVGTLSVFVVRVSAPNSAPNLTLSEIENRIFRSSLPSFKSQYEDCSFGQLKWTLAGGMDVQVEQPIGKYAAGLDVVTTAEAYLRQSLGVPSVAVLADRIVFCVAPGTAHTWIASAAINHWRAVFNDDWCTSLSGGMHELGHTLGLLHSGELNNKYGDLTGYMGYGSISDVEPRKCFNGYQSWQLGWYEQRQKSVATLFAPGQYKLVAFVEYPRAGDSEYVLLILDETYFLIYNRAEGFNSDTGEKREQVTITERSDYGTNLLAGLSVGANYTVPNYKGTGLSLVIEACSARSASGSAASAMVVAVGVGRSYCGTRAPSTDDDDAGVSCMTESRSCFADADCCGALRCRGTGDYNKVCTATPCTVASQSCSKTSDCCDGLSCDSGVCQEPVQVPLGMATAPSTSPAKGASDGTDSRTKDENGRKCSRRRKLCDTTSDCCNDLRCIDMVHRKCRHCRREHMHCTKDGDCCNQLECVSGTCKAATDPVKAAGYWV